MANKTIKTLKAFTTRNASTGKLLSYAYGQIYIVDSTLGTALISSGLAEEYSGAVAKPYGTKSIIANGSVDVAEYETASVNVPNPSTGTLEITENGEANVTDYAKVNVAVPSDFEVAEVTLVYTLDNEPVSMAYYWAQANIDFPENAAQVDGQQYGNTGLTNSTNTLSVLMYKGEAYLASLGGITAEDAEYEFNWRITPTIEGACEFDDQSNTFLVSGDCTITCAVVAVDVSDGGEGT